MKEQSPRYQETINKAATLMVISISAGLMLYSVKDHDAKKFIIGIVLLPVSAVMIYMQYKDGQKETLLVESDIKSEEPPLSDHHEEQVIMPHRHIPRQSKRFFGSDRPAGRHRRQRHPRGRR